VGKTSMNIKVTVWAENLQTGNRIMTNEASLVFVALDENERPMAYVLILEPENKSIFYEFEAGAAATNVMLLAEEKGIQSCCLMLAEPEIVNAAFDFKGYKAMYAIALGKAAIESKSVSWAGNQAYYMEENGNFCVPKRNTEEVLVYSDIK